MKTFDVAIAGLGAMGSAAAYYLTGAKKNVIGFDRFDPPHDQGSHFGQTRIIREAYFEHPLYVPMVQRAYECWAGIEKASGEKLFLQTGGLTLGAPESEVVQGTLRSAKEYGIACESLSGRSLRKRFPVFNPGDGMEGVLETRAGILFPEKCIAAFLKGARHQGMEAHTNEPVEQWAVEDGKVKVTTARGIYWAEKLLISSGAWTTRLLPGMKLPLTPDRNVLFWFRPKNDPGNYLPGKLPVFLVEHGPGKIFYGFPDLGDGVKIARHHAGDACDPDTVNRTATASDEKLLRDLIDVYMPGVSGERLDSAVCLYTNTPDEHFVIDFHPAHPEVLVASPCSGHGFKFSSAVGEICSDLLTAGKCRFDLAPFKLGRF